MKFKTLLSMSVVGVLLTLGACHYHPPEQRSAPVIEHTLPKPVVKESPVVVKPVPKPPVVVVKPKPVVKPPVVVKPKPKPVVKPKPKPVVKVAPPVVKPKPVLSDIDAGRAQIEVLSEKVMALINDLGLSKNEQKLHISKLLETELNIPLMGRLVLDKNWDVANETQQVEYLKTFRTSIIQITSDRLVVSDIKKVKISEVRLAGKKKDVLVRSKLIATLRRPVLADWRLRKDDNGVLKIIDLSVKGFSMILTLRGDFGSVVKTKGIAGLIKLLKDKETK